MFVSFVNHDGTTETHRNLSRMDAVALLNQSCAEHEEKHGIPLRITEYCEHPDLEHELGWTRMTDPTEEEESNYDSFCPPIRGYMRTPPTLLQYGVDHLQGRTIVKVHHCLGSYGMGGPGWIGLELDAHGPPLLLIYCMWGSTSWVQFSTPHESPSYESTPLHWKIQRVELEDRLLRLHCLDTETLIDLTIQADETPSSPRNGTWTYAARHGHGISARILAMGELWYCCRPDGGHWC
jgi:hypothetical protein